MAAPLPPARQVVRITWVHWLALAWLVVVFAGLPIAFRLLVPTRNPWIGWALHLVPLAAWGAALAGAVQRGESPWLLVDDPARPADLRRTIYATLDVLFATGYLIAFHYVIPNRHAWAMALLEILPLAIWTMAIGTRIGRRWSWWLVIAGGAAMLVWMIVALFVLQYTATYLAGVYGAFGKGAASGVAGIMLVLVQFVALVPALQLKWIMTRSGRRQFGLAPLWPAPTRGGAAA